MVRWTLRGKFRVLVGMALAAVLTSCQSLRNRSDRLIELSLKFHRLGDLNEVQCEIKPHLAEPVRASWGGDQSGLGKKALKEFDALALTYRASEARCVLTGYAPVAGSSPLVRQLMQQLDVAVCVWLQSFYGERPMDLTSTPAGLWLLENGRWVLPGKGDRKLMIDKEGKQVQAVLGEGRSLTAHYSQTQGAWLPWLVEFQGGKSYGELTDLTYERLSSPVYVPRRTWLRAGADSGSAQALVNIEFNMCRVQRLDYQSSN